MRRPAFAFSVLVLMARGLPVAGSSGSCAGLVDEFYGGWPCMPPSEELERRARENAECLRELLTETHDERTSLGAYWLLRIAEPKMDPGIVLDAVHDARPALRALAVGDLPRALDGAALQAEYFRLLHDPSLLVRYDTIEGLTPYPAVDALPRLTRMFADTSIEVRHRALDTIARWNLPGTTDELDRLSRDPDPTVAGVAAFGLARYYHRDAPLSKIDRYLGRELRTLVGPPYAGTDAVVALIAVLGAGANPNRFPALHLAEKHPHPAVSAAAKKALSSSPQH